MSIVYFCISFTLRIGQLPFIQNLNIWLHLKATSRRMWNVSQCTNCIQSNPSSGKSSWHWWIKGSIFFFYSRFTRILWAYIFLSSSTVLLSAAFLKAELLSEGILQVMQRWTSATIKWRLVVNTNLTKEMIVYFF